MTTVEQLLLQIFDRKKGIIEQVKQQTELYNQHLASKLILDGITPPSWLLSPNNSPGSKELNREELISKIIRPKAPPSVCCSSVHYYNNLIHTRDNGENNDGFFLGTLASNKDLNIHDVPIVPNMSDEVARCSLNTAPEVGHSINSPENHIDGRTSKISGTPEQSLARIQRSKSRQKAVELRSSAKALDKSGSNHENISGPFSSRVILSSFATDESGQKSELQRLPERRVIGESCKDSDLGESNSRRKENRMDIHSGRITRSKSHVKATDSVEGSPNIGCSADYCGDYVCSHGAKEGKRKSGCMFHSEGVVNTDDSRKTSVPSTACSEGCEGNAIDQTDFQGKNIFTGRVSKSNISSKHQSLAGDLLKADISSDDAQIVGTEDDLPAHHVGVSMAINSPSGCRASDRPKAESSSNDASAGDNVMMEPQDNLIPDHVDGPVTRVNPSDLNESSGVICTGIVSKSNISSKHQSFADDLSKADISFDDSRKIDNAIIGTEDDLPAHHVDVSMEINSLSEGCRASDHSKAGSSSNDVLGGDNVMMEPQDNLPADHVDSSVIRVNPSDLDENSGVPYIGRVSKSNISSEHQSFADDLLKSDISHDGAQKIDNAMIGTEDDLHALHVDVSMTINSPLDGCRGSDHLKAKSPSNDALGAGNVMMESQDNLPANHVDSSVTSVNSSDLDESSGARKSTVEDIKYQKETGANLSYGMKTYWSSSQYNTCVGETPDKEIHPSVKADDNIILPSSGKSALQAYNSDDELGLSRPSFGTVHRVTGPQILNNDQDELNPATFSETSHCFGNMSISDPKNKFVANDEPLSAIGSRSIPPLYETHSRLYEDGDAGASFMVGKELVLSNSVGQFVSCNSEDLQTRDLELPVTLHPSSSFVRTEPKELDFSLYEESSLENSTSNSGKKGFDNHSKKIGSSFLDSLDKEMSGVIMEVPRGEESPKNSDILSKGEVIRTDSFPYDDQENLDSRTENNVPIASEPKAPKSSLGYTEAELNCENNYEAEEKADIFLTEIVGMPDLQNHLEKKHDPLPEHHVEEGDVSGEAKDRGFLVSIAPGSKTFRSSYSSNSFISHDCLTEKVEMDNSTYIVHDKTKQVSTQESQALQCRKGEDHCQYEDIPFSENVLVAIRTEESPQVEDVPLEKKIRMSSIESCPQPKRRKIEYQQANSYTNLPSVRMRKLHSIQRASTNTYLQSLDMDADPALMDESELEKSTDMEMHQVLDCNLTRVGSTSESQNKELGEDSVSILPNNGAMISQGCSYEEMRTSPSSNNNLDASDPGDRQCSEPSNYLAKRTDDINLKNSTLRNRMLQGTKSSQREISASNKDHDFIAVDESMPVFEGFIVDAQEDCGEVDIATYGLDFDNLNLPSNAIERASILVEMCRSASSETPLSSSTSAYDFQGTQHLYQSQIGFSDNSLVNGVKDANERVLYSDCLPYSGSCYGWKNRNRNASPVGKLWERLSFQTGSSEKSLSSNPELACFTIDEDSSTSADNEEIVDDAQKSFGSVLANHFDKRPPLKDMTNVDQIPAASVEEVILTADGSDFVSTKSSVVEVQDKVRPSRYPLRNNETRKNQSSFLGNSLVKKNQTQSIGGNGIMKSKESILNRSNKTTKPSKSRLKRLEQKPSMKESRANNIISNVNSFLPLVQQKQAAPICAGKRDVKVKSLEAAEAAKRLEEKKENERKMRKEAMKLERAKLEEKNLIQMELDKKKKIEDRKKKDADVIEKKRFREEEERKGKGQKRMRIEARQLQKEQEEKSRAEKAEKDKQRPKDEQMNSKQEYNETKKQQKMEILRGNDDEALKKPETKLNSTGLSVDYEECGISGDSFEVGKGIHMVDKSPSNKDLIIPKIQGSSYEISPYQCSDDEDEEDVVLPTKKYIPPWASKSSLSLSLTLQQSMNPDVIFPPESSCSMDEVLLRLKI